MYHYHIFNKIYAHANLTGAIHINNNKHTFFYSFDTQRHELYMSRFPIMFCLLQCHAWLFKCKQDLNLFLKTRVTCTFSNVIITVLHIYSCHYQFVSKFMQCAAQVLLKTSHNYAMRCTFYAVKLECLTPPPPYTHTNKVEVYFKAKVCFVFLTIKSICTNFV